MEQVLVFLKTGHKQARTAFAALFKNTYNSIPTPQRPARGLPWVGRTLSRPLYKNITNLKLSRQKITNDLLYSSKKELKILGLFLLAEYGRGHPKKVFNTFRRFAKGNNEQVRQAATLAFRYVMEKNRTESLRFLKILAFDLNPLDRRFICEALLPVGENRWLLKNPQKSLAILKILMWDGHLIVKKALGNNLSELSRTHPALILDFLAKQLRLGNLHTYWIAYRACHELAKQKKYRKEVLSLLKVDEYCIRGKVYR